MIQILIHLWGDYILQSDWMAQYKTKDSRAAFIHAGIYTLGFLLLTRRIPAIAVIFFTHAAIDRFRLARYVVWMKNWIAPLWWTRATDTKHWQLCSKTGYSPMMPDYLAFWLLIIADNTLHLTINYLALRFL